jgi:nucleotide-binding universal stress UspA family protein
LTGLQRLRLGSTAEDVTRSVPCPAMIVGPNAVATASERFHRILCATNFAAASLHALHHASALAGEDRATLILLHVLPPEHSAMKREQLTQQCGSKLSEMIAREGAESLDVRVEVQFGKPAAEIVRRAREVEADLVVMGAHAAGRASTFLPSTLHDVLTHAPCPVLTTCGT